MRQLRVCRETLIALVLAKLQPTSPTADAASLVLVAIDRLADAITGIPDWFNCGCAVVGPGTEAEELRRKRWEDGGDAPSQ